MLTQSELKRQLHYDHETGIFTWVNPSKYNIYNKGLIAGHIKKDDGYIRLNISGKSYYSHRLAWLYIYGEYPLNQIDHINMNKSDNRICNLRECTASQNRMNIGVNKNNNTGFKGVSFFRKSNKYRAEGSINNKTFYLGLFDTAEEASQAYKEFALNNYGEFARF